jgi:hypothetical protein
VLGENEINPYNEKIGYYLNKKIRDLVQWLMLINLCAWNAKLIRFLVSGK